MSFRITCLLAVLGFAHATFAQQEVTKTETSAGISYVRSNTADGMCQCFSLVGASSTFVWNASERYSGVVDVGYQRSTNINATGNSLGLMTYMAGPRISFRGRKYTLFGQALAGGVRANSSGLYNNASGFAGSAGGGLDFQLTQRLSWRILQADYLLTRVPNGSNNVQNNIRFTTGIVLRLGWMPPKGPRRPYNRPF
jgi:outer membrane immunogenic protein